MQGRKKGANYFDHGPQNPSAEIPCHFLNILPLLTRPVLIESSHSQFSIGTGFVKNGAILRKLWVHLRDGIFGRNISAYISVPIFT